MLRLTPTFNMQKYFHISTVDCAPSQPGEQRRKRITRAVIEEAEVAEVH